MPFSFSEDYTIRKARYAALAHIRVNQTKLQRVVLDSHQRSFYSRNEPKSQASLLPVIVTSGFFELSQCRSMKPDGFQARE